MMELFSPPAAWFLWTSVPHSREPLRKGLDKPPLKGFIRINKIKKKKYFISIPSLKIATIARPPPAMIAQ
jgi:hypothetical protein